MDDLNEVKEELRDLVFKGKKDEAIRLLQERYQATPEQAEKLLVAALKEMITPEKLVKMAFSWGPRVKKTIFKFIAAIMGIIGIPILLAALGVFIYSSYQVQHSVYTTGVVTEIETHTSEGQYSTGAPVIAYEFDTQEYSTTAGVFSNEPEFAVGDTVPLYVSLSNPESVIIDTFTQRWLMIVVIGAIGFAFTASMVVMLVYSRGVKEDPGPAN